MFFGSQLLSLDTHSQLSMLYKKTEAQYENLELFQALFNFYSNIAVTRYEWEDLPSSVNERFLNQTLYLLGKAAFFEDEKMGYLALPCSTSGEYNIYYEPTVIRAYSINFERQLTYEKFIQIRNNPTCTPTALHVFQWCRRMSDVIRTIDVLCKKMKQPFIILCDDKRRQTYLNLIKAIDDNETIILGIKDYDLKNNMIEIKDTKIDIDLARMWEVFHQYENMLYNFLGINNASQSKRERLLVDEVNANNMAIDMSIETNIKELQTACELINKRYGLNISVSAKGVDDYLRPHGQPASYYDNPVGGG